MPYPLREEDIMAGYTRQEWEAILDRLEEVYGPDMRHRDFTPEELEEMDPEERAHWAEMYVPAETAKDAAAEPELTDGEFLRACGIAEDEIS